MCEISSFARRKAGKRFDSIATIVMKNNCYSSQCELIFSGNRGEISTSVGVNNIYIRTLLLGHAKPSSFSCYDRSLPNQVQVVFSIFPPVRPDSPPEKQVGKI